MKINKKKLIETLKILKISPKKTISILNDKSRHLCYSRRWRSTIKGKYNVKFINDPNTFNFGAIELSVPTCIILSKDEIKRAKAEPWASKYQKSALISEFLFDNPIEKLKLIEVLKSIKMEE